MTDSENNAKEEAIISASEVFPKPNDDPKEKCPRCGKHIKYKNSKYCTNCGQRLAAFGN